MWCKQFLRSDRIAAESMPEKDRTSREEEGYVEGINTAAPSVISLNTVLAGLAVTVFLELVTDFMAERGSILRLNYDIMNGTVARGSSQIPERCTCKNSKGFGDLKTLLTICDVPQANSARVP